MTAGWELSLPQLQGTAETFLARKVEAESFVFATIVGIKVEVNVCSFYIFYELIINSQALMTEFIIIHSHK